MSHLVLLLLCLLAAIALASVSLKSQLGIAQVVGDNLAANIISSDKLQPASVGTTHLQDQSVTSEKIAPFSVSERHIAYQSVTAKHLAIETVEVLLRGETPLSTPGGSSQSVLGFYENRQLLKPANIGNQSRIVHHYVDNANFYEVSSSASGPGQILGWYPSLNGHLLRYQTDRAFNQMRFDVIQTRCGQNGLTWAGDNDNDNDNISDGGDSVACKGRHVASTADAGGPLGITDGWISDALDWYIQPVSVGDVRAQGNEDMGTPVYSPSVERITIDEAGIITVRFAGRGMPYAQQPDIIISVVVLRNNALQYQENPSQYTAGVSGQFP